ncbi:MAG: dihydroneopterin aldolase family protein [Methanobacterium sp. ERen5]|nr:MAG: dihydroneopterin aldolase family protein [Methanobacterium sp. ERen5]
MNAEEKYFDNITNRERAIFEGAITMGALFHQFVGTPVNIDSVESLEKAIEAAMSIQPCVSRVEVGIDRKKLEEISNEFDYVSLSGEMLDVKVTTVCSDKQAMIRLKFVSELNYPLMYVEDVD